MNFDWAPSKYKPKDLDAKDIQYKINLHNQTIHSYGVVPLTGLLMGEGKLTVQANEKGLIRAGITMFQMAPDASGVVATRLRIPIEWVEQIVKNPTDSKVPFSLDVELRKEDKF
jgi:hypothetical protein